jgi:hypothetical protein
MRKDLVPGPRNVIISSEPAAYSFAHPACAPAGAMSRRASRRHHSRHLIAAVEGGESRRAIADHFGIVASSMTKLERGSQ